MDPLSVVDICGDTLGNTMITRNHGYIESLNYPDVYSPYTTCTCRIVAQDPQATIKLSILDINLSSAQTVSLHHDWLEVAATSDQWGEGRKLNYMTRNEEMNTMLNSVYLNFRTDGLQEGRGFWLQYQGEGG